MPTVRFLWKIWTKAFIRFSSCQDLKEKQLVSHEKLHDSFYTVTRENTNKKIELIADQNLFDNPDEEPFLQKNYVFVQVSTQPQPEDWIDVMIDPGRDAPG